MKRSVFGGGSILAGILTVSLVAAACSTGTGPDVKPTRADVSVTGDSPVPLRLIVSTDFVETLNTETLERSQIFNSADTTFIQTLPYSRSVQLTDLGSIVVDLSNPDTLVADVRLRVDLDSGRSGYDRSATMSQGGALRYVFSYFSPVL